MPIFPVGHHSLYMWNNNHQWTFDGPITRLTFRSFTIVLYGCTWPQLLSLSVNPVQSVSTLHLDHGAHIFNEDAHHFHVSQTYPLTYCFLWVSESTSHHPHHSHPHPNHHGGRSEASTMMMMLYEYNLT